MRTSIVTRMSDISETAWNALVGEHHPFVEHAFLSLLETSNSVGPSTGWEPAHVLVWDSTNQLVGAAPSYIKTDSYGEYIFDWMWANVAERIGIDYYPKIVVAVPFTPATGPRLLVHPKLPEERNIIRMAMVTALRQLLDTVGASSIHILFCLHEEMQFLENVGLIPRYTHQFHWRNHHYGCFDDFLQTMKSSARKQIRKERRLVQEADISTVLVPGSEAMPKQWDAIYHFYQATGSRKWGTPYLTREFFADARHTIGHRAVLGFAHQHGQMVAGTLSFEKGHHLYGRYWGSRSSIDCLHFELCYYQLIEYAIQRGYTLFEAGAQGEHKLKRGFLPTITHSAHDMIHPVMRSAFATVAAKERSDLLQQIEHAQTLGPFRAECIPPYPPFAGQIG